MRIVITLIVVSACGQPSGCGSLPKRDAAPVVVIDAVASPPVDAVDAIVVEAEAGPPVADAGPNASIVLMISTPRPSNCADITAMTLGLATHDGACVATPVLHERAGRMVGTYVAGCPVPAAMPCVEQGDVLTMRPIAAGAYLARVDGFASGVPCWRGDASIGALEGVATAQTLVLLQQADPRCGSAAKGSR